MSIQILTGSRPPTKETMKTHVIYVEPQAEWQVWLDTGAGEMDGICLGSGKDLNLAIHEARLGLVAACKQLGVPLQLCSTEPQGLS